MRDSLIPDSNSKRDLYKQADDILIRYFGCGCHSLALGSSNRIDTQIRVAACLVLYNHKFTQEQIGLVLKRDRTTIGYHLNTHDGNNRLARNLIIAIEEELKQEQVNGNV